MSGSVGMQPVNPRDALVIAGFSSGGWVVNDRLYAGTLLIAAQGVWSLPPATVETVDAASLEPLADLSPKPTLLLLGTGDRMQRPSTSFLTDVRARGLSVEFMDSRAAARTYNVLVAEQRAVAALLL